MTQGCGRSSSAFFVLKALSDTSTVTDRPVAYHQAHNKIFIALSIGRNNSTGNCTQNNNVEQKS